MRVISTLALLFSVTALKVPQNKTNVLKTEHHVLTKNTTVPKQNTTMHTAQKVTQADVDKLHKKLETLAGALESTVETKLSATKIGPEMKVFVTELKKVLVETKAIKDPAVAMKKLSDARAGMAGLTAELTGRQEDLMKEDESQKESLLLGVLMTRQKEPIAEQMKVLQGNDFADLPVSRELLAKHDNKTALYVQVANYLDSHKGALATNLLVGNATERNNALAKVDAMAKYFEQRVGSLEKARDAATKRHVERMDFFEEGCSKGSQICHGHEGDDEA